MPLESSVIVSDEMLLAQWCAGNVEAGNELIARYFKPLLLYFRSKLSSEDDVQDLLQTTLVACTEQKERRRLEEVASFGAYLFGIARHKLLSFYGRGSRRFDWEELGSVPVADLSPGPSTLLKMQQRVDLLLMAMGELSIDQQTAIQLKYWNGMKQREVADALGVPPGTVARRIHDATRRLATEYAELERRNGRPCVEPEDEELPALLAAMARRLL